MTAEPSKSIKILKSSKTSKPAETKRKEEPKELKPLRRWICQGDWSGYNKGRECSAMLDS